MSEIEFPFGISADEFKLGDKVKISALDLNATGVLRVIYDSLPSGQPEGFGGWGILVFPVHPALSVDPTIPVFREFLRPVGEFKLISRKARRRT